MRIPAEVGNTAYLPLPTLSGKDTTPRLTVGTFLHLEHRDTVELSSVTLRELPDGVIIHETPRFFFNTEINETLDRILSDKAPEISKAAYQIIESNLFASNRDLQDEERTALREAGLAQTRYLAEHFMNEEDATTFLQTMHLLAALSTTRKVDPATEKVSYAELPNRPKGAPADYVQASRLMERFDPAAYSAMQAAASQGKNPASLLLQFAKKLQQTLSKNMASFASVLGHSVE